MAIQLKGGAEFLHIPKTGGSWVKEVLQSNDLMVRRLGARHLDYDLNLMRSTWKLHQRLGNALPSWGDAAKPVFRFCFVRHPLAWYESWWKYMQGLGWRDWGVQNSTRDWHPNSVLNGLGSDDFNQFVRNVVARRPGYVSELYSAYTKPGISLISRAEHLQRDFFQALDALGVPYDRERIANTTRVNVSAVEAPEWDPELRQIVVRLELPALVMFDYLQPELRDEFGLTDVVQSSPCLAGPHWRNPLAIGANGAMRKLGSDFA